MQNEAHQHEDQNNAAGSEAEAPLASMQAKLAGTKGRLFWRAFEQVAETPEFKEWIEDEFPNRASLLMANRRQFLTLGGAALAMAGLTGCRVMPQNKAVPYVRSPEELVPGIPLAYASTLTRGGYAMGVLVESREGRPIKIEGNPRHPASLGSTDVFEQAEILTFYDPDRSQSVTRNNEVSAWDNVVGVFRDVTRAADQNGGTGVHLLTDTVTSPLLASQIQQFLTRYPNARWHRYEPAGRDNVHEGTQLAFGRPLNPVYRLKNARVIVSLDGDFLKTLPGNVRYARDFADGRRVRANRTVMNRLYMAESSYSITGAMADHRFAMKPSDVELFARALHARITGEGTADAPASVKAEVLDAMVRDIQANAGAAVFIPGDEASPAVHAIAHALNGAVGAIGKTVIYTAPVEANTENGVASLKALVDAANAGQVQSLFILGGNPVYNAPRDLNFAEALVTKDGKKKIPLIVRLGQYEDETSAYADWHIPEAHPLEAWSDARAFDGTVSIVQPLIAPLFDSRSVHEFMAELIGQPKPGYEILIGQYQANYKPTGALAFEKWFQTVLHDGVVPNTALPAVAVTPQAGLLARLPAPAASAGLEIAFRLDPTIWDGRYANNSWLQEIPKPITTLVWDNAAMISPATAQKVNLLSAGNKLDITKTDATEFGQTSGKRVIELTFQGQKLQMPVWILPGQPDDVITVHLGFGRTRAGVVGNNQGFNTYLLRSSDSMNYGTGLTVGLTNNEYVLSHTQAHHLLRAEYGEQENRDIYRAATLQDFIEKKGLIGPVHEAGVAHGNEGQEKTSGGSETGYEAESTKGAEGTHSTGTDAGGAHGQGHGGGHPSMGSGVQGTTDSEVYGRGEGGQIEGEHLADPYRKHWYYTDKSLSNKSNEPSLYPEFSGRGFNQWAMNVDLNTCIGCNACVIACQAENNIPTVGKDEVGRGRRCTGFASTTTMRAWMW
jgi:molybdopterin-containing oxidoreductase family iron-sulfur binding subunit